MDRRPDRCRGGGTRPPLDVRADERLAYCWRCGQWVGLWPNGCLHAHLDPEQRLPRLDTLRTRRIAPSVDS